MDDQIPIYLSIPVSPDVAPADLDEIQLAVAHAAHQTVSGDRPVKLMRCMYLPAYQCMLCAFDARDEEAVHAAVRRTDLDFAALDTATASRLAAPA